MPKLVQKCGYIRNGSAAKYMRYIATREGVEKLHGRGPVTQPQKELIERLLKDYPDTKELFEYSDYCASPTFGNASELITMALDANVHTMEAGDGYLKYIATRPRVEKRGDHGLFSDTQDVSLQDMMAEVAEHHGPVWTVILLCAEKMRLLLDTIVLKLAHPPSAAPYTFGAGHEDPGG